MMITNEQVLDALRQVMHPETECNLVELGVLRDVVVQDSGVTLTLVLPFEEILTSEELVRRVSGAVGKLDASLKVRVKLVEMSQQERAAFITATGGAPGRPTRERDCPRDSRAEREGRRW